MITNYPDKWIVLEISSENHGTFRKILSSWYGGYLGSDSWRLSSVIINCSENEHAYEFNTETSSYICNKNSLGMNLMARDILKKLIDHSASSNITVKAIDNYDDNKSFM